MTIQPPPSVLAVQTFIHSILFILYSAHVLTEQVRSITSLPSLPSVAHTHMPVQCSFDLAWGCSHSLDNDLASKRVVDSFSPISLLHDIWYQNIAFITFFASYITLTCLSDCTFGVQAPQSDSQLLPSLPTWFHTEQNTANFSH